MAKHTLSPAFPMDAFPDCPGVYRMKQSFNSMKMWSKWDGRQWHTVSSSKDTAERSTRRSIWAYDGTIIYWYR